MSANLLAIVLEGCIRSHDWMKRIQIYYYKRKYITGTIPELRVCTGG